MSVGNSTLTLTELREVMPKGLTEADSAAFAESYINNWISNKLITEVALKNLPDSREIDRQTEEYRRNLIMWEYVRLKISQDASLAVSRDSVNSYFSQHRDDFITSEPLLRGTYVRVPSESPSLANIRRWYRSSKSADVDRLEKAELEQGVMFDYFVDRWAPASQIRAVWPSGADINLTKEANMEVEQGGQTHLLHITDVMPTGSKMPIEVAEPLIRKRLEAARRVEIERKLRADMLRRATDDGTITRYN